jgi:hypothetical protein
VFLCKVDQFKVSSERSRDAARLIDIQRFHLGLKLFRRFSASADEQGGTQLEAVNIELWSEYDHPSMLVIQEFVLAEHKTLPTEITLRFPKNANLIAVAFNNGGQFFNAEFEGPKEHGNWQIVILNVRN